MKKTPAVKLRTADSTVLPCSPEAIWPVLAGFPQYPRWWPASLHVKVIRSPPEIFGTTLSICPFRGKAFTCTVVSMTPPARIGLVYEGPFIVGTAEWRLETVPEGTRVVYDIDVAVQGLLVPLVARLLDLKQVHSSSMRGIFRNLRHELNL